MTQAALLEQPNRPLRLVDLEIEGPGSGEVLIEIGATGVCHSDIAVCSGELPARLPLVLGHEAAGTVVSLGDGVSGLSVGDRVVLTWLAQCGTCPFCLRGQPYLCSRARRALSEHAFPDGTTRISLGGRPIHQFCGLGTFSRYCVVLAEAAVPVPEGIPFEVAALMGCAVLTGFGAAVNTARVGVGDSVAVLGCGGVGLSAVQGARVAGAAKIIAIDVHAERLELAERMGATHTVKAGAEAVKQVRRLTGGLGADVVLELAGRQETVRDAVAMARPGGQAVLVSAPPADVTVGTPVFSGVVLPAKTIRGSLYGSVDVRRDIPRLVELYERGLLKLEELVTARFDLGAVNDAVRYATSEQGSRAVIEFDPGSRQP
jgi:alcohol dehydrogenase/S-(hydroxymethyl)glutathione dehydrogenase/alcohol dehydrogenase